MSRTLEFFYDYGSPFSYLADAQVPALCRRAGAELVYRPMLLGGVFKSTGNRSPLQEPVESKRRYGMQTLRRWVEHCGVPFAQNPHFPIDTTLLMRGALAAGDRGVFDAYHRAVFRAFWAEAADLGDRAVVGRVLGAAGLDAAPLFEAAADPALKARLRAATDEAVARGVFGAPSFLVGEQVFFGNDHLHFAEKALRS